MRTLVLLLIIFQLILSGCSPEGGFHASTSTKVTVTDPNITPNNSIEINPRPTPKVPNPSTHHLGYLSISNAKLDRNEDGTLVFKATLSLKDKSHNTTWTREVELDGSLDIDYKAKLYPVKGDTPGDFLVRARVTCMYKVTCGDAIIDVFVNDKQKTHGAQVYAEMEQITPVTPDAEPVDEPKSEPKPEEPKTSTKQPEAAPQNIHPTEPAQPIPPQNQDSAPTVPSTSDKAPSSRATPQLSAPRADVKPQIPSSPEAPIKGTRPPRKPEVKATEEEKQSWLRRIWPFGKKDKQEQTKETSGAPPSVMSESPQAPQTPTADTAPQVKSTPEQKPQSSKAPELPKAPQQDKAPTPPAAPLAPVTSSRPPQKPQVPQQSEPEDEEELEHGNEGEDEEDEEGSEDEERPSLFIGTLHEPSDDLFEQDRPTPKLDESARPKPRPTRPEQPQGSDDIAQMKRGDRPRDQVIGKTACGKGDRGPSCGFLERASDLSALENTGNFAMFNKSRKRHYGSYELVTVINHLGKYFRQNPAFGPLSVNDLSQRSGGRLANSAHKSHQNGLDADISYPFNRSQSSAFAANVSSGRANSSFKARETWIVFKTLWNTGYVDRIFVNPAIKRALCQEASRVGEQKSFEQLLRRIRPESGHDKHFHLRILCSSEQPRCRQMVAPPAGSGC